MRIALDRLSKRFGTNVVVDGLSLEIRSGEFFALLGPSGSGKSTVLSMISGLEAPDRGSVVLGNTIVNDPAIRVPPRDRRIGMVFQDLGLWPHLTVREHLRLVAPREDHGALLKTLEILDRADAKPSTLSGGEAQRLAIARALAARPDILLMDEPLGPLDRRLKERLQDLIEQVHRRAGTTSIYVTHDYEEVYRLADRVGILIEGRLAQVGTPEEVYSDPASEEVARLTGPVVTWRSAEWGRPEWLQVREDPCGPGTVRRAQFLGGRWVLEIEIDGRRIRAFAGSALQGRVDASFVTSSRERPVPSPGEPRPAPAEGRPPVSREASERP